MPPKKAARTLTAQSTRPSLREAALLAALCTVLGFQQVRYEPYDAEKASLILVLAVFIIALNLIDLILDFKSVLRQLGRAFASPAILASIVLLIVIGLSTLTSLDFASSAWGSDLRFQGWITWACYLILFWQATRLSSRGRKALLPVIMVVAVPLCLWAFIQRLFGDATQLRPGSTTGQPDYLSSWLVIATVYVIPQLVWSWRQWNAPLSLRQRSKLALCIAWIVLVGLTFYVANSRAAVLGLVVSITLFAFIVLALQGRKRLLLIVSAACLLFGMAYAAISFSVIRAYGILGSPAGVARYFYPYDGVRLAVWDGASRLLVSESVPLTRADGQPDSFVALRPLLGYGPDTTEQTQIRFMGSNFAGAYYPINVFLDRLHNLIFDSLATTGWLGFIALLAVYLACMYAGLKALGLIAFRGIWLWLVAQGIGAVAGVVVIVVFMPATLPLAPLGGALGMIGGFLAWIVARGLYGDIPTIELTPSHLVIISIICIIGGEWIDHQFGFLETASQVLFWILAGLLVSLTTTRDEKPPLEQAPANYWSASICACGIFLISGMQQSSLIDPPFVVLLVALWLVGSIIMAVESTAPRRQTFVRALQIAGIWLVYFAIRAGAVLLSARLLSSLVLWDVQRAFEVLAVASLIGCLAVVIVFMPLRIRLDSFQLTLIAVLLILAGANYVRNYAGSALHGMGNSLQAQSPDLSNLAYQGAVSYLPNDPRLHLHWATMIMSQPSAGDAQSRLLDEQIAAVQQAAPFFVNGKEWADFLASYRTYAAP